MDMGDIGHMHPTGRYAIRSGTMIELLQHWAVRNGEVVIQLRPVKMGLWVRCKSGLCALITRDKLVTS